MEKAMMPRAARRPSWKARIDLALGVIFLCGLAWCFHEAELERRETILRYGYDVDSGAYLETAGTIFLLPIGLMFLVAGLTREAG